MKICITGATGFVGAHLVRHFAKKGHEIVAVGRQQSPPPALLKLATWLQADLTHPLPKINCDICLHAAGLAADKGTKEAFFAANFWGTKHIFEAVTAPVFIHISSASVYPFSDKKLMETDAILSPKLSNYGYSKLQAEQFLKEQQRRKKTVIIFRPRAIYGTHDRVLLPRILQLVKLGKIRLPGDGKFAISMTHIDNLIAATEQVIHLQPTGYQIFNVSDAKIYDLRTILGNVISGCFDKEFSVQELPIYWLKKVANLLYFLKISSKLTPQSLDYMTHSTVLDLTKIQQELGYASVTNFEQELPKMVQWVRTIGVENILANKNNLTW